METITIPSPSAFLRSPVLKPSTPALSRKAASKKKVAAANAEKPAAAAAEGVTKPKQSKSRNGMRCFNVVRVLPTNLNANGAIGCVTCKAKRLKCDETKPTCQQCRKRNVECGGYKKDFKWRSFEEATFASKPAPPRARKGTFDEAVCQLLTDAAPASVAIKSEAQPPESPSTSDVRGSTIIPPFPQTPQFASAVQFSPISSQAQAPHTFPSLAGSTFDVIGQSISNNVRYPPDQSAYQEIIPPTPRANTVDTTFDETQTVQPNATAASSFSSGHSPRLIDLLLPGTELHAPPPEHVDWRQQSDAPYQQAGHQSVQEEELGLDDEVEEIVRQSDPSAEAWIMRLPSPSPSASSSSSSSDSVRFDPGNSIYNQPRLHPGSPEMLMMGFDTQTCGILSVKDGPTENPWRTLVWPLAQDSPALYHAISSMTAFHTSKLKPSMKVEGMEHMRRSILHLASGIENMRTDTALATTLALAFSESWDVHVSTGIEHLRGAKILVNQVLTRHRQNSLGADELVRIKFLYNTWIYMNVIARLTNVDDDASDDFETLSWPLSEPFGVSNEVDPLMGCATTLFPLIGRVANLVRRVRKSATNSINVISQANELKSRVEMWEPPLFFEAPEDPTSHIQDSLQTAEAYRWATLLYLHQAVPEIPSKPAAELAKQVLVKLATVPPSSRAIIVQIYPLLAAGCEAESAEDRAWVEERWVMMTQRMLIGNIDRCLEVVKEVWDRRDSHEAEKLQLQQRRAASTMGAPYLTSPMHSVKRAFSPDEFVESGFNEWGGSYGGKRREGGMGNPMPMRVDRLSKGVADSVESIEFEKTVRGPLHWVGVMKDWKWEGEDGETFLDAAETD